ncbi:MULTISPECIES: NAD(P)/FAD-dependent oxidoreductase [Polaribacter]|uniref:Phytoene desaturase family protein n=1 Tax=Polaribacter sejongensis TaxID=985043 RepID=A0AAJ1QVB0_9FLAO|nr:MULTISPECIES: phytoene desaturase family protein [Polaribacter]MDN3618846.1 phytoene desaturase family protein [Polaribacter undariae]UWD32936.1 phytoene desaturase family protein [Polaribacter undariae]
MKKKIYIIGSGFSALSASCYLAKAGYEVIILEKNDTLGGRARQYKKDGFTFDIGPSWYWMPDVFERFFADFDKKPSDYYTLDKLNPGYEVYFGENSSVKIASELKEIYQLFEDEEKGSAKHLKTFLDSAKSNYDTAIKDLVYQPGVSPLELVNTTTIARVSQFFSTIRKQVRKDIKSEKLIKILEFPVLFLGAKPNNTPAFYNFMNYADFGLGTWHPRGGMYTVIEGMVSLAKSLEVTFKTNANVEKIITDTSKNVTGLLVNGKEIKTDLVLSGADYHHTETLLDKNVRQYSENYWEKKTFAPSSLLFYVGFDKKIENVSHHTLFFDTDFDAHAKEIYDNPQWPTDPLFYANFTSITDKTSAPEGKEAGFFLIPLAPGIEDTEELREEYFHKIMDRFEALTNQEVKKYVLFKKSFCVNDFKSEYNSYKGNAYGMANTLLQTAFLRPKIKSSKIKNLYFTGQLTVPGPGVPPALISGKIASELIFKNQL